MGVKKSTVCTRARSSATRYTPASSLVSNPTRTFGSVCRGRRRNTESSRLGLSLAAQPAALTMAVSLTVSAKTHSLLPPFRRQLSAEGALQVPSEKTSPVIIRWRSFPRPDETMPREPRPCTAVQGVTNSQSCVVRMRLSTRFPHKLRASLGAADRVGRALFYLRAPLFPSSGPQGGAWNVFSSSAREHAQPAPAGGDHCAHRAQCPGFPWHPLADGRAEREIRPRAPARSYAGRVAPRIENHGGGAGVCPGGPAAPGEYLGATAKPQTQDLRRLGRANARDGREPRGGRNGFAGTAICGGDGRLDPPALRLHTRAPVRDFLHHIHFPARRMDAHHFQHVVSVAGGNHSGRHLGTRPVPAFLPARRSRSLPIRRLDESQQPDSFDRRFRGGGRADGSVSGALSKDEDRDGVDAIHPAAAFQGPGLYAVAALAAD